MKYHLQTIRHDPENGSWGNCMQTALACILDLEIEEVPHFFEDGVDGHVFQKRVDDFLLTKGLSIFAIPYTGDLDSVLESVGHINPKAIYLLSGETMRGANHVVICRGGGIIHDPHPGGSTFIGPCSPSGYWWVEILTPILGS